MRIKIGKSPHPMGGGWANAPRKSSRASMRTRNTVREVQVQAIARGDMVS